VGDYSLIAAGTETHCRFPFNVSLLIFQLAGVHVVGTDVPARRDLGYSGHNEEGPGLGADDDGAVRHR
jgi:hypothetical protein